MATNVIVTALRNTLCDAFVDALEGGTPPGILEIGTDGGTGSFGTLLATLTFSNPAYGNAASGTAQESAITSDSSADTSGTAAVYRVKTGTAGTVLWLGTVNTSGADINFNSVDFVGGDTIAITDLPVTMPAGTPV
jgi:hypothetical protein